MKLPPSALLIKLFSDLPQASRRSSSGGKVLLGSLVALSVFITISHFPGMELPSMNLAAAAPTPATSNLPLFGNPTSEDFMSYAVSIMPTVPGANLNTSNVAGSTNCDLLVPVTYIDAGCMNSLPLLFPFNEPQHTNIAEPTNQTFYNDYNNSSALDLSIGVASDNITAGDTQTVTVSVSDQNSTQPIPGALVLTNVTDSFNSLLHQYSGTADEVGQVSFPFVVPADAASDIYTVSVLASADGYENTSASTTFDVIGSGDFFDNITNDNFNDFSDSSSDGSSDNCCDSSNDDFTSPEVKSTDPSDGDNNVALNTDIKVTFDEKIDDNTIDSGSLDLFNLDGTVDPFVQSVSTSSKSATFSLHEALLPNTHYEATISSDIEDNNGNFLDCSASKGVDSSCQWQFSTSGGSPQITLSPNSGPVLTSVDVTGTGFDPDSIVTLTFGSTTVATATTTSTGNFAVNFNVPLKSPAGDQTVKATQGGNSGSDTFTVTPLLAPVIILDPAFGAVDTLVDITGAGFDPNSIVTVTFGGTAVATVTTTLTGSFDTAFNVPQSSSVGNQPVIATQGSNSASKLFTVTSSVPIILLDPLSGPVGTSVDIIGAGFAPSSTVGIAFNGNNMTTTPPIVATSSIGVFFANFEVPQSSTGPQNVVATQGSSSASRTFNVTSSLAATSKLNANSFIAPSNQSNTTKDLLPTNQSNASVQIVTNSSFDSTTSNGSVSPPLNTSSAQATENISMAIRSEDKESSAPSSKEINNTSLIPSTDNTMNNIAPTFTSTQNNDTSNNKKSSEKSISIGQPKSEDQLAPRVLTNDNTTHEKASSVTLGKNIIDTKHETSQKKLTSLRSENDSNTLVEKVKSKGTSSQDSETQSSQNYATEKSSSVRGDKTNTKVTRSDSDNQPDKQSSSSDSIKKDRALFFKYLNANKNNVKVVNKSEVNNRPVAINDEATTESNIPVKINILGNDKDPDGDKLSVIAVSRPVRGAIESDADGTITYSPLKSWSGTERFGYTISDGRGGVATGTVTVIVQNQPPEAEDQDISVNANNPIKIKLEAKDPDNDKLKFVLVTKPSHGRIVQFSSSTGTLGYVPDENYDGKDDFAFKVHDGTVFSKDAKVSIKIEKNEKLSNEVQGSDQQQKKEPSRQSPTNEKKSTDDKSNNNDTPPSDSSQQSSTSTQDTEQQKTDQKVEEQQSSPSEKHTGEPDPTSNGDSQPTS